MKFLILLILIYYTYFSHIIKIRKNDIGIIKRRSLKNSVFFKNWNKTKSRQPFFSYNFYLNKQGFFLHPYVPKKLENEKRMILRRLKKEDNWNKLYFQNEKNTYNNISLFNRRNKFLINKNENFFFFFFKEEKKKSDFMKLLAKLPVITINKKLYPKEYSTDYENVLRKFEVTYINYKTRLRSKKEIDIRSIDDLYGQIYDRNILKKQFYFFLYHDDINTCYRILNENRNVLTREESFKILNSLPYIFVNHLKYIYPTAENIDDVLSKLLKTYIFQYANDKNIDYLNFKYKYNELDEYCKKMEQDFLIEKEKKTDERKVVPQSTVDEKLNMDVPKNDNNNSSGNDHNNISINIYDDEENADYEKKYKHMSYDYEIIESTKKYKDLIEKFKKYPENIKLEKVQLLYTKILSMKGNKIYEALRKHESIKKNEERKLYRNARLKVDPNKLTPYVNEPIKYDKKKKIEINKLFEKYVEEKDLKNAALILRKYTNLIDTVQVKSRETMKNFLKLHSYIYTCNKYNEKELAHLRMIYYSTVQKPTIIRKICEVGMREQGENVTHGEVYQKELNRYLKERDELRDERLRKKNINIDEIRDFTSAYPMEWLPVIYRDVFEQIEKEKDEEKNKKPYDKILDKNAFLKKKKEYIKNVFSPSTDIDKTTSQESLSSDPTQNKKKKNKFDFMNETNELKVGRNVINYKKRSKINKKKRKDKSPKEANKKNEDAP
ncbi:conserved Plasmodium protein, unknown function [Plasmodium gaboni]|uniref:Uncharacterized protein n=1 Tax=Plasmodium gaboni TaxID=647221 RepID=A0ABY1UIP1_9APIC|nr:conserved Plasmodium protein, unknown function [Plasmodium gaboni]